jgi:FemAB-related protein (PEP-CTERM system-associated)
MKWTAFVHGSSDASLAHDVLWRRVFDNIRGYQTKYLMAVRNGSIEAVLPLVNIKHRLLGNRLVSVPILDRAGVLAEDEYAGSMLMQAVDDMVRGGSYGYAQIRSELAGEHEDKPNKVTLQLDISSGSDPTWKSFDAKVRNQVRKAEKSGLITDIGGLELLPDFFRVYSRNMRDLGVPSLPAQLFTDAVAAFGDRARVVIVRKEAEPVGGGVIIFFKDIAAVPWASSSRNYFELCPNNLLYWSLIKLACERGSRLFDFGRSTPDTGPFNFKRQWGADVVPLIWHYCMGHNGSKPDFTTANPKYRLFVKVWQRLPICIANTMGPMISSQVA